MNREQRIKEIADLIAKYFIDELEEAKAQPPKTVLDLTSGDKYWMLGNGGTLHEFTWRGDDCDINWRSHGDMFLTRTEARREQDYRAARTRVKRRIAELNDGWVPNWKNEEQPKFTIYYNHELESISTGSNTVCQQYNNSMHLKSRPLAQQLIKEMPDDLKIILTY